MSACIVTWVTLHVRNFEIRCLKLPLAIPLTETLGSGVEYSTTLIAGRMFMHFVVVSAIAVGLVYLLWEIRP